MQIFSLSLLLPFSYLTILISSMYTFSYLYRKRQSQRAASLAPYFPTHTTRNVYLSLLHLPDSSPGTKVPDSVLRAALLSRACTDIERIMHVRTRKPALSTLLQRGVVGDEIWQRLLRAEQELELELKDVVQEAHALANGWGQTIFQSAGEMVQNRILREKLDAVKVQVEPEKKRWEETRERTRKDFEKELEGGEVKVKKEYEQHYQPLPQQQQHQQAVQPVPVVEKDKVQVKSASSDEDGVMVETPGVDAASNTTGGAGGGGGGGGGGKKKKKNKNKN